MILDSIEVGPLLVNCYLIGCETTGIGAIVDPGDETERILHMVEKHNLKIEQIINTHGHSDHIYANGEVKEATGAKIYIHPDDAGMLTDPYKNLSIYFGPPITSPPADEFLEEGKPHRIGELEFTVFHVPGHSPGSVCLYRDNTILVGDAVFNGSIGRTDFPGGSLDLLLNNIKAKILSLDDNVKIYPGHGPPTTVAQERKFNPFLRE